LPMSCDAYSTMKGRYRNGEMAESNKKRHGGPGRGQGRKPVNDGEPMVVVPMRMTPSQREKLGRLGGAGWVRDRIDETPEPTETSGE
jgi:hypothetical protein